MLKIFKKYFASTLNHSQTELPSIVTFTGGMGAQMISAAIYFQMKLDNKEVYADLSYFDKPVEKAVAGVKGQVSQWGWQLHDFYLEPASFVKIDFKLNRQFRVIEDGALKLKLGLDALNQSEIKNLFAIRHEIKNPIPDNRHCKYLCIHVRRGDYVNVASHLVSDQSFYDMAARFAHLVDCVVVVSDSVISTEFQTRISSLFQRATFLDDITEYESHCIMRKADILMCSNSQFSLIAALLNKTGLVVLPRTWFGKEQVELEAILSNLGDFQIFTNHFIADN